MIVVVVSKERGGEELPQIGKVAFMSIRTGQVLALVPSSFLFLLQPVSSFDSIVRVLPMLACPLSMLI